MNTRLPSALATAAALAVLLGATAACRRAPDAGAAGPVLTATATTGPLVISVTGSGDINSRRANKVIPRFKRSATLTYLVPEGSRVTTNDVVARFNTEEIERQINDLETQLAENQNRVDGARTDLEIQLMDNTSTVQKAEQDLRAAQLDLQKYVEGDEPLDRRNAELTLQTALSDLDRRQKKHVELKELLSEGFVTEDEVEEARMAAASARISVETAEIEKKLLETYTIPQKKTGFETALLKAKTEMDKARKQTAATQRNKEQALLTAQRVLERTQSDLDSARKQFTEYTIRAPAEGVVTYGDPEESWRRGEVQVGANFQPGQVLMTIPDMADMQAVVNIPEADIHTVRAGLAATVTVEALANRTFDAAVTNVAEVANSGGWWSSDVKEFKVRLTVSNARDLKPGFSCKVEIVTETIPSTLYLPVQAVFREGDRYVVYPDGDGNEPVEVKIGRASTQFVEILGGIETGARVRLSRPDDA